MVRAQTPRLLEVGKAAPKIIFSFAGAGFLVTYSLGVAKYLQQEKQSLLAQGYFLGAGSGVLPAVALAAGPQAIDLDKVNSHIVDNIFNVSQEPTRVTKMREACELFLPSHIHTLMNGRCALAVSMSNRDTGFLKQAGEVQLYGNHICIFDNKTDVTDCILAATCPNSQVCYPFRGMNVVRATQNSLASQLDQYIRHVYVLGLAGNPSSRQHQRHVSFFGRHGALVNTHDHWASQLLTACRPATMRRRSEDLLRQSYENGFHDARRYERWEEDVYHFAKPDRAPSEDDDWRTIRGGLFSFLRKKRLESVN